MAICCLAFHAAWRCRHSGACCQAGWSIPIEGPAFERVRMHYGSRDDAGQLFVHEGHMPEGAVAILGRPKRRVRLLREGWRGAPVRDPPHDRRRQSAAGVPAVSTRRDEGPAAARLSRFHTFAPPRRVCCSSPSASTSSRLPETLALDGEMEGLDATAVLPPLLRPNLLTDLEGYDTWEHRAIATLADDCLTAGQAAETIEL